MRNRVIYLDEHIYHKLKGMRKITLLSYIRANSYYTELDYEFYKWLKESTRNLDIACQVVYSKQEIAKKSNNYYFNFKLPGSDIVYTLINNSPLKPSLIPLSEVVDNKCTLFTETEILNHKLPLNLAIPKED